jgi:histidinol dehydrogenase
MTSNSQGDFPMFPQYDPQSARQSILKRLPMNAQPVPQHLLAGIAELFGESLTPEQAVGRILETVRQEGDIGLRRWATRLDGDPGQDLRVSETEIQNSLSLVDPGVLQAMQQSAERIEAFHQRQPLTSWLTNDLGGTLGQLIRPIQRVGLYVPGGTAPLPSSVLMSAIPARVAGVSEIVVVSPAQKATGKIAPIILAACAIAGVEEVYAIGGAQAIAALAYGTPSVPAVHKIVGPGNLFVTLAKRQVYGLVGIDGLAGPTETMVIADDTANPAWVAADLLAQAEHDVLASAILLTPSQNMANSVRQAIAHQLEDLPRAPIVAAALENRSGVVLVDDLAQAVELANLYGPEHLCLSVATPWSLVEKIHSAGGIFLGEHSFEVLGDYIAGPSHVMPTGGSARFASPLNVWDFVHIVSLIALDSVTAGRISAPASEFARAEQLEAHARSALLRMNAP